MSMSQELKIISLIMFLIKSNRNVYIKVAEHKLARLKEIAGLLLFIFVLVWCFYVVICFIGAVFSFSILYVAQPVWPYWQNELSYIFIFSLNWYLPVFQSVVTTLLVPLPVYWSVLFYRVTILKALLFLIVFISARMLVCCRIDWTFYTLPCLYRISTHSPA